MAGGEDRGDGEPVSVVTVRVQYLEDTDPFACANFPEPRRAPTCSLDGALPLGAQIPAVHRLLGAPLKVSDFQQLLACARVQAEHWSGVFLWRGAMPRVGWAIVHLLAPVVCM
uniref:cDNA FLJ61079, moderately similar to FH1/FH2 domain-containing protein n=1 Tax=Homo sapiens TaxID=9606 RepID=B4E2Z4_HUMAN|nr:unnamed protein product [Homo sapiens]